MSAGPWQDGPSPITGSTTFSHDDHAPRFYADPDPKFGGNVAELIWNPLWDLQRSVTNTYLDADPRYQQVWDILRGHDANDSDAGLLYQGSVFSLVSHPDADWSVQLTREPFEVDGSNVDTFDSYIANLASSLFYSVDPWPPGAVGFEYEENDGYGTCTGTVSVAWDVPDSPFINVADIGGVILAPLNIPVGDRHFPYSTLSTTPPGDLTSMPFTNNTYVQAFPDALLSYTTPPPFAGSDVTLWAGVNLRFTVNFEMTFPRYRFLYAEDPARRLWPRDDSGGIGVGRVWPAPTTPQYGRRFGSAATL